MLRRRRNKFKLIPRQSVEQVTSIADFGAALGVIMINYCYIVAFAGRVCQMKELVREDAQVWLIRTFAH